MKRILITGGAGFIGFHLCKKFLDTGYKVDLVDNFKRGIIDFELKKLLNNKNVTLKKSDLLNFNTKDWPTDYDKIFHLAAIIGVKHVNKDPYSVLTQNIYLLDNVIRIARKQKKLSKFMFSSTSEVYSGTLKYFGLKIPTPENSYLTIADMQERRTSYMISKIYGELMCNLSKDIPHINIRPHNFYGPRMGLSHVIPELMQKMYKSKNGIIKIASPKHKRSFCYITDAIEMIFKLSESRKTLNKTYNIGSFENSTGIFQLAKKISKIVNKDITLIRSPSEAGSPSNRQADMKKLKKTIKFKNIYTLDDGLQETYNWYLDNIFQKNKKTFI
ncbi:NAD(P)-dependent oxidoreductase [Candidatus Pelagibacter sp.]|nr:NAD(P)-dependent oxidoreductase [Candidatus Pelagibacter sp.]